MCAAILISFWKYFCFMSVLFWQDLKPKTPECTRFFASFQFFVDSLSFRYFFPLLCIGWRTSLLWIYGFMALWFYGLMALCFLGFKNLSNFHFMFSGRYWSHIEDFQDFVRRIFIMFRRPSFAKLSKGGFLKIARFINTLLFERCPYVPIFLNVFCYIYLNQ